MKLTDILRTASGNLLQSKLRTFLTVIAIFIGAFTLTLTTGMGAGISQYIDRQLGNIGGKDFLIIQPAAPAGEAGTSASDPKKYDPNRQVSASTGFAQQVMTQKDIDAIRAQDGITKVDPFLTVAPDYITGPNGERYQVTASENPEGANLDLAAGSLITSAATENQVVMPVAYVPVLGFSSNEDAIGKTVTFAIKSATTGEQKTVDAKVAAVQRRSILSMSATGGQDFFVNKPMLDALYAIQTEGVPQAAKEQYFILTARFDTSKDVAVIKSALKEKGYNAMTVEDQIGIVKQVIGGITIVFSLFGAIALIAASFGVINTLLMAVQERTKEIGLMKAIGLSGRKIFLLFSAEAILLGFWGSLLGVLAAYGVGSVINQVATNSFLKDFDGLQLLAFPLQSVATIMLLIMVVAFLAGTLPARRAAKLNPIDALRYE